jgi:hypothetical protein
MRGIRFLVAFLGMVAAYATFVGCDKKYEYQSCYKPGEAIPPQSPYFKCVTQCCVKNCAAGEAPENRAYELKSSETFLAKDDANAEECWGKIVGDADTSCPNLQHFCSYGGTYDTQSLKPGEKTELQSGGLISIDPSLLRPYTTNEDIQDDEGGE